MSFDHIHHCPRCELKFEYRSEVEDHLRADHAPPVESTVDLSDRQRFDAAHVRVMAAVDPHRLASPAAEVAGRLAHQLGGGLDLVAVVPPDLPATIVDAFLDAEANRQPLIPMRRTRLAGDVSVALLDHIEASAPTLVVLDSHGRRALAEVLIGSVSADVIRSSPVPTLVIGPNTSLGARLDRFVVGVDGSDDAVGACEVVGHLAGALGAQIHLAEVLDPEPGDRPAETPESVEVRRVAEQLDPPPTDWDVLHGADVADALIDHVALDHDGRGHGTVLVVGTHGRSPGRHRPLGGTSARIVRRSPVPVLVVSPEAVARRRAAASGGVTTG